MIQATQVQQNVSVTRTMTDKEARFESSMFRRECRNGGRLFFSNSRTQYSRLLILNPSFEIQRAGTVKKLVAFDICTGTPDAKDKQFDG